MPTFTNQATLSYNNTVTSSNIATGELVEVLSVTKTALRPTYADGDDVTYVLSIVNSGNTAFTGLTVNDNLGAFELDTQTLYPLTYVENSLRYYVNGALQAAPAVLAGPPLAVSGITVPAGGNAIIAYEARPNEFAPLGAGETIVNSATVSGGGLSAPVTATETVTADEAPRLNISKSISPTVVAENDRVTYTFIIQNTGNADAVVTDNVTVTDTFNPILSDLAVTLDGVTQTSPAFYTYNEVTGEFATVPGAINVPAATYTRDPDTGAQVVNPGVTVLTVSGII